MRLTHRLVLESFDASAPVEVLLPLADDHLEQTQVDCDELATMMDQAGVYQELVQQYPSGTVLTASEEKLLNAIVNMSLAGTGLSMESLGEHVSLEGMASNMWEAIKKVFAAIVAKIKQFFHWVTGNKDKANKQHEKVAEALKGEAGKEAMKDLADSEKQKAAEHVSTESHVTPGMMRIGARQVARYMAEPPKTGLLFVDDAVWEVCEQLEVYHKGAEAIKSVFKILGDVIPGDHLTEENYKRFQDEALKFMHCIHAQDATHVLGSQGTHGALAAKLCGVMYLEYDPATVRLRMVSNDSHHDYNRSYVIAVREANKLTMHYDEFVKRCRTMAFSESGAPVTPSQLDAIEKDIARYSASDMTDEHKTKASEFEKKFVSQHVHFFSMAMTGLFYIVRASMTLDHDLMKWVPKP